MVFGDSPFALSFVRGAGVHVVPFIGKQARDTRTSGAQHGVAYVKDIVLERGPAQARRGLCAHRSRHFKPW